MKKCKRPLNHLSERVVTGQGVFCDDACADSYKDMKTLPEVMAEEREVLAKFIEPGVERGFDNGYRGAEPDLAQKAWRDRYAWQLDIQDWLTAHDQRIIMAIIDMAEDMQVQEWKRKNRDKGATSIGYSRIIAKLQATLSPKE